MSRPTRESLDDSISRHASGWTLDRIAPLERNILRVAVHEMRDRSDIPDEVAIDEAVEAAKELCWRCDCSRGFINGAPAGRGRSGRITRSDAA